MYMGSHLDPPPTLAPLDRVLVIDPNPPKPEEGGILGEHGVILWRTSEYLEPLLSCGASGWLYVVHFPAVDVYQAIAESRIVSTRKSGPLACCLGRDFEISYDPDGEGPAMIAGAFRTPGDLWATFVFRKASAAAPMHRIRMPICACGVTFEKHEFDVPGTVLLDAEYIEQTLSAALGAKQWRRVPGPQSSWFA